MWNLLRDVKLGLRTAWRSPGYSAIAILTMALAIGANTLIFSIANPLVIRPLPIANQHNLGSVDHEKYYGNASSFGLTAASRRPGEPANFLSKARFARWL